MVTNDKNYKKKTTLLLHATIYGGKLNTHKYIIPKKIIKMLYTCTHIAADTYSLLTAFTPACNWHTSIQWHTNIL